MPKSLRFDQRESGTELLDFVREHLRKGQTGRAVDEAEKSVRAHAGSGDAQSLFGDGLLAHRAGAQAVQAYLRAACPAGLAAAMLDSAIEDGARSNPAVLALRSEVAAQLGDFASALEFAWRVDKLQPFFPPVIRAPARVSEDQALVARLDEEIAKVTR